MRQDENIKNLFYADEGKIFVSKTDKEVKAESILLANWDSIENYNEVAKADEVLDATNQE